MAAAAVVGRAVIAAPFVLRLAGGSGGGGGERNQKDKEGKKRRGQNILPLLQRELLAAADGLPSVRDRIYDTCQ